MAKAVKKTVKKKVTREPSPSAILKKVATVTDSNKTLQKEIKAMSKIFGENQKILVSMKSMIDTLTLTLEQIQRQSKKINIIEEDTQKLYAGLNQVRTQSNIVSKINDQIAKLDKETRRISAEQKAGKSQELSKQVKDSMNSIKNNSQMIIKIAQRIDEVRDDLRKVSGKTNSFLEISAEIDKLKNNIEEISGKTAKLDTGSQIITSLKEELGRVTEGISANVNLSAELDAIKVTIDSISSKAAKIDSLGGVIDGLKEQFQSIASKASSVDGLNLESIKGLGAKIDKIEKEIGALSQRADSTEGFDKGLKSIQDEVSSFKQKVADKTDSIGVKLSTVSDTLKRQDELTIEFHKKSDRLFQELQSMRDKSRQSTDNSSKEMMALLKLSEYQSTIRMNAESKYGKTSDIENMAKQTAEIVNLFDRISIESGEKIPLPHEVRQWAISKILDCADKWEVRFSDVYSVLKNAIGKDMLKESIRIQQVRDIYGIRAVDEIRGELDIT